MCGLLYVLWKAPFGLSTISWIIDTKPISVYVRSRRSLTAWLFSACFLTDSTLDYDAVRARKSAKDEMSTSTLIIVIIITVVACIILIAVIAVAIKANVTERRLFRQQQTTSSSQITLGHGLDGPLSPMHNQAQTTV